MALTGLLEQSWGSALLSRKFPTAKNKSSYFYLVSVNELIFLQCLAISALGPSDLT